MAKDKWNDLTAKQYIGEYRSTYFGYSSIESIRKNAASGGIISTLLIDALREKKIDGALVCRSIIQENGVKVEYFIATSDEEIYKSQGSKYITSRFSTEAVPLIREFNGNLAIVGRPCDILIVNNMRKRDPELDKRIKLVISVYCGHSSDKELTDLVIKKLNPKNKSVQSYRYRFGHWRGLGRLVIGDSEEIIKPFSFFSDYQNMFFYCETKCLQCVDQTGFYSDISVGDIWDMRMKKNPIKHNSLIVRTDAGETAIAGLLERKLANIFPVSIGDVCAGQSRSLPLHANVNARAWAGKRYGLHLKPSSGEKLSLLEKTIASITLFNYHLSRTKRGQRFIAWMPRFLLKIYLYAFKALQQLQKPKRIYHTIGIIGGSIWGNRGAESMLVTTIAKLKEKYPEADFMMFSIYPKKDRELINDPKIHVLSSKPISLVTRFFPFALLDRIFSSIGIHIWLPSAVKRLKRCSILYDIGGITFAERGAVLLYNIFTLWPAILLRVPVVKLSQAVGPFKSATNRHFAKRFLGRCQKLYARGEISQQYLADLKLSNVPSEIAADIAFSYQPEYSLSSENLDKVAALSEKLATLKKDGQKILIISPSSVVLKKLQSPIYEKLILEALQQADCSNYYYIFLPNSNRAGNEKSQNNDIFVLKSMQSIAKETLLPELQNRMEWIDWDINTRGIREIMQYANLVVTSRFHAMISSLALAIPVYVIGWSHKYQEVLQMFGLEEYATDFSHADKNTLAIRISQILDHETDVRDKIIHSLPNVVQSSQKQFDEMEVSFN